MCLYKETIYADCVNNNHNLFLITDIREENTVMALVSADLSNTKILYRVRFETKKITCIIEKINWTLRRIQEKYHVSITQAVVAAAGVVVKHDHEMSGPMLPWVIKKQDLLSQTPLEMVLLINNFEAANYGITALTETNLVCLSQGNNSGINDNTAIIGAGNHLGARKCSISVITKNDEETALVEFLKTTLNMHGSMITWDTLLSKKGLQLIYQFLKARRSYPVTEIDHEIEISNYHAATIAKYRHKDRLCQETFSWFVKFYGRYTADFINREKIYGGIYIAGSIASKNTDAFEQDIFLHEFNSTLSTTVPASVPIYLVKDYNVILYGAALYGVQHTINNQGF